jgi:hypothetical protein
MNGQAPSDRSWLDAERANLIALAAHGATTEWAHHTVALSRTLFWYLNGGYHADAVALHDHTDHAAAREIAAEHMGCSSSHRPAQNPGSSSAGECSHEGDLVEFRIYPTEPQAIAGAS